MTRFKYSKEQKKLFVSILLTHPQLQDRSNRDIAALCGIYHKTVGKCCANLQQDAVLRTISGEKRQIDFLTRKAKIPHQQGSQAENSCSLSGKKRQIQKSTDTPNASINEQIVCRGGAVYRM